MNIYTYTYTRVTKKPWGTNKQHNQAKSFTCLSEARFWRMKQKDNINIVGPYILTDEGREP